MSQVSDILGTSLGEACTGAMWTEQGLEMWKDNGDKWSLCTQFLFIAANVLLEFGPYTEKK